MFYLLYIFSVDEKDAVLLRLLPYSFKATVKKQTGKPPEKNGFKRAKVESNEEQVQRKADDNKLIFNLDVSFHQCLYK